MSSHQFWREKDRKVRVQTLFLCLSICPIHHPHRLETSGLDNLLMTVKKKIFATLLVIISCVSIAISAWQYQVDDGDMDWNGESFTKACKNYPLNYVRRKIIFFPIIPLSQYHCFFHLCFIISAFQISRSGQDKPAYCGYGLANTAFRLAVACVTCILGALLPFDVMNKGPSELLHWVFFVLGVFWFSATVSDCTVLVNSTEACVDWWEDTVTSPSYTCENGIYGKSIYSFVWL